MACDEQQFGSLSRPCLRKKDDTFVVSSEHIQGKDDLINRKNLERSSGNGVPDDDVKRSTQAIRKATLRGKGDRETPHSEGTGTKTKIDGIPLPGNNCRPPLYRGPATIGAAADVRVQNRDNITRSDDVEESRKDLIVRSHPRGGEERGLRQNKSGVSQVANTRVQSRSDIAEGYGPHPEDSILYASPHIYEIMGCDYTNKDGTAPSVLRSYHVLPLPVYTQDEFHADPNRILSTVPASESSVSESAHPNSGLGLHLDWFSRKRSLQCTVVPLRLGLEIFDLILARQLS